jgi:hypothetical protein
MREILLLCLPVENRRDTLLSGDIYKIKLDIYKFVEVIYKIIVIIYKYPCNIYNLPGRRTTIWGYLEF